MRVPLNYRGISLLLCVTKKYSSILNHRRKDVNILLGDQKGFRRKRGTNEHVFASTTVLLGRPREGKDTFCCFVDFEKAFGRVDRSCLFYSRILVVLSGWLY